MNFRIYFFLICGLLEVLVVSPALSQPDAGGSHLEGRLIEAGTGHPLDFIAIKLLRASDSLPAGGALTADGGKFRIAVPKPGAYLLLAEPIGYSPRYAGPFDLTARQNQIVGDLVLETKDLSLDAVEITAARAFVTQSIDKRAYNVEQLTTVQGGTALDVLNNIPSVSVDFDGGVSLRGTGNVNILINGKPSSLTQGNLASLQAADIESVEIITNPSSKYDPDGTGGIINIVFKKNRKAGGGGSFTAGAGTRNKYNAGLRGFYQQGKINLSGSYNYRYDNRFFFGTTDRTVLTSSPALRIQQQSDGLRYGGSHAFQSAADFQISSRQSLSLRGGIVTGRRGDSETNAVESYFGELLDSRFERRSFKDESNLNFDFSAGYRLDFNKKGHYLTADATWSLSNDREDQLLRNFYPDPTDRFTEALDERQTIINPNPRENTTLQIDYTLPLARKSVLEAGLKSIYRFFDNDFQAFTTNLADGALVADPLVTNRFVYNDQIHSAYAAYSGEWKKFSYKGGLRFEQTWLDFELRTTEEQFKNQFTNLFPSVFIGYKFSETDQMVVNYGKRINRPGFRSLNPFPDLTNPFNLRAGNPNLRPELVDSYELNYLRFFKHLTLNSGLYHRQTNNAFTRIIRVDDQGVARIREENAAVIRNFGWDNSLTGSAGKFWTFTANANIFRNEVDAANIDSSLANAAWVGLFRLNQTFALPAGFQFQINGYYNTPRNTPQGRFMAFTAVEIGLRKKLFNDNADLIFTVTDLFDTQQFQLTAKDAGFEQQFLRKRESRVGLINFTYRFGKTESRQKSRQ